MTEPNLSFRIDIKIFKELQKEAKRYGKSSANFIVKRILRSWAKERGIEFEQDEFDKIDTLQNQIEDLEKQLAEGITLRKKSKD
jgi:hypothetical protein